MAELRNNGDKVHPSQQRLPSPFALLIDADNTEGELVAAVIEKAHMWGELTLRRAYGNQEVLLGQKWKELCLQYALQPIPHLEISGAKNATDIALAIDAIDLLHTQGIRRFCLVTGDQGFTSLVLRLRSYGCEVYCIGKPSKAAALTKVCTEFFSLSDVLVTPAKKAMPATPPKTPAKKAMPATPPKTPAKKAALAKFSPHDPLLTTLLTQAMREIMRETQLEWILVSRLGPRLQKLNPQFEAKKYGQKNLPALCRVRADLFECRPKGTHLEVRLK